MADTDKKSAMTYPTPEQYQGWKDDAEKMDMSVSEWMQAMIEAGRKKFDAQVEPDESAGELREQRNDLKEELDHARNRIDELETQLHHGERKDIQEFVEENPGATYSDITQHISNNLPERVKRHLDELEGKSLRLDDDGYYPESDG